VAPRRMAAADSFMIVDTKRDEFVVESNIL
jgi:hypothetical protein